jgi:hypothetical protein
LDDAEGSGDARDEMIGHLAEMKDTIGAVPYGQEGTYICCLWDFFPSITNFEDIETLP